MSSVVVELVAIRGDATGVPSPGRVGKRRGQTAPVVEWHVAETRTEDLEAHVVGAGVEVLPNAFEDRLLVADRHQCVDESFRPAADGVALVEALAEPAVSVVRKAGVDVEVLVAPPHALLAV